MATLVEYNKTHLTWDLVNNYRILKAFELAPTV